MRKVAAASHRHFFIFCLFIVVFLFANCLLSNHPVLLAVWMLGLVFPTNF